MSDVPKGYPGTCNDKELKTAVKALTDDLNAIGFEKSASLPRINQRAQLAALIQLGLGEIQGRRTTNLFWFSTIISMLSAVVAFSALYVSLTATRNSTRWENRQIEILEDIDKSIISSVDKEITAIKNEFEAIREHLRSATSDTSR